MNTALSTYTKITNSRHSAGLSLFRGLFLSIFTPVVALQLASASPATSTEFAPVVSTTAASAITSTSATLGGNLTYLGDSTVTSRGVVYSDTSLNASPAIGGTDVVKLDASGVANSISTFSISISGLDAQKQYTFRAFAINSAGTSYGDFLTFNTPGKPAISSPTSESITSTTASLGGDVTGDGGNTITERGVVLALTSSNADPLIDGANVTKLTSPGTTGVFVVAAENLQKGSDYSFKAYAKNSQGIAYTDTIEFTTLMEPTLASAPTSSMITSTSAELGGNITSDGLASISERGVVYSITADNSSPQINEAGVTKVIAPGTRRLASSMTGVFTVNVTGLANGTAYTFAAYATNSEGTTYSNFGNFQTIAVTPVISVPSKTSVQTSETTAISSATLGGNVSVPGSETIDRGVVYSLTGVDADPQIGDAGVLTKFHPNKEGTAGAFSLTLNDLLPFTSYTFKAFAKNNAGTVSYTAAESFTTPAVAPLVNSGTAVSAITSSSVRIGGNVTKTGGQPLVEVGVVYSITTTNDKPELGGLGVGKANASIATGVFSVPINDLEAGTQYTFRAFGRSAAGANYSSYSIFTTTSTVPTIISPVSSSITSSSAILGATVTKDGSLTISQRGIVYSLTAENNKPEVGGPNVMSITASGSVGSFTLRAPGLDAGKKYSYSGYATNSDGTAYTAVGTFITVSEAPSIGVPVVDSIFATKATIGGNVIKDNGAMISERGVVYSLTSKNGNPQLEGQYVTKIVAPGTTGAFKVPVAGLAAATKYSFAVYAKNSVGTTYSSVTVFTTAPSKPGITTPTIDSITASSATLGGEVTRDGGAAITERGVVYSIKAKNPNPSIGGSFVTNSLAGGTTGIFQNSVNGLQPYTQYVFKAYATNSAGTAYTKVVIFTTSEAEPTVSNPSTSDIGSSTAKLGGIVTKDNGADVTDRGVVYSLSSVNDKPRLNGKGVKNVTTSAGLWAFSVLVSDLEPGEKYSFAAYASNSVGAGYSPVASFTMDKEAPTVNNRSKDEVLAQSAVLGGNVARDGGANITERGIVYSSSNKNPRLDASGVSDKTVEGTTGIFSVKVTGLDPSTLYYFRAYARNSKGISYTDVGSFTTKVSGVKALAVVGADSLPESGLASIATDTCYTVDKDGLKYRTLVIQKPAGIPLRPEDVEVSGNLTEWFSGDSHTSVLRNDAEILKVRDNTPVTSDEKRYIRLKM